MPEASLSCVFFLGNTCDLLSKAILNNKSSYSPNNFTSDFKSFVAMNKLSALDFVIKS